MKKVAFAILFFTAMVPGPGVSASTALIPTNSTSLPLQPVKSHSLTIKDIEKLTGKKLSLKEKLAFKILAGKIKKDFSRRGLSEQQRKLGVLSLLLGATSLLFLAIFPIVSIPLAIAGLITGIKSVKGNSNTAGILGIVFSGITIGVLVLAIIVVASWGWY